VPADYEKIRQENIQRYGWDTAVLDLLGHLYSERTHFIFELIQNAEDAGATELTFELFQDRLEVRHNGRPFTEADVRGICGISQSSKSVDLTKIGKFGIGFKSVYAYTKTPHVHSSGEHFRIEKYVQPYPVAPLDEPGSATLFVFPFDRDDPSAATAVGEISSALGSIEPTTLLFLRHIERVRTRGPQTEDAVLERVAVAGPTSSSRHVMLVNSRDRGRGDEEWLVWHRGLHDCGYPDQRVEIAFRVSTENGEQRLVKSESSPLVVFFPTAKETFLGFLTQGPYRTTPARDNIPEHDPWNQALVRETAALLADVLHQLRDEKLLTVDALLAMPLDVARFQHGTMFRPLFESVRVSIAQDELIPTAGDGYGSGSEVKLARGAGLRELLAPDQLGELYDGGGPLRFAHESITENLTPVLWRYLESEIGVDEVTPGAIVARLTSAFLAAQSDEWTGRFYAFLHQNQALWRVPRYRGEQPGPAGSKPIIRLEDGSQVTPFGPSGRPAAYLPGATETEFPTVRRAVASIPEARQFLEALKFTEPDVVAEVLDKVLPRYNHSGIQDLDPAQHQADLDRIVRALADAGADRLQHLREQLQRTPFIVGENAATGERRLMMPAALYQRTKDLETYFDGNPGAWFVQDGYQPWFDRLRGLGVRTEPAIHARTPDYYGYVVIVADRGQHVRGVDRFDPGAQIDGLEFALRHPNHAKSEYIWNVLLAPNRHLIAGVIERSGRQQFINPIREDKTSPIGIAATAIAWLPGPDGTFRRPGELQVNDLPSAYKRDEVLAKALGMVQPVVEEASRQLGLPPDVLLGLSEFPDLVEEIQQRLKERAAFAGGSTEAHANGDSGAGSPADEKIDYITALSDVFERRSHPGRDGAGSIADPASGIVNNPGFRRERVHDSIEEDKDAEPLRQERFQRVPRRIWEAKDDSVRQFLLEQYGGHCQICDQTFLKRDNTPYFEGLYLVARTQARWLDRPGNVISLCATCCAKFQYGTVYVPDIFEQIITWRTRHEGGCDARLTLRLCGERVGLRFTEKHLLDLQEIVKTAL
jgi:hypothetical protein